MRTFAILILFVVISGVPFESHGQSSGVADPNPTPGLSLSISTSHVVFTVLSPIALTVILKNDSGHDFVLWIDKSGPTCTYRVDIHDGAGNRPPDTRYGILRNGHVNPRDWDHLGFSPEEMVSACANKFGYKLKAGESFSQPLDVTSLYNLTKAGKYTVQLTGAFDSGTFVRSNPIAIRVTE
jgi:hypothetical protein